MNSYLKELTSLLVKQILAEDDAAPNGIFGKWLFGPDQKNRQARQEENNKIEDRLEQLLGNHYSSYISNNSNLGKFFLQYIKPELKKGNYAKYLAPPNTTVYRGMSLTINSFSKIVKMDKTELVDIKDVGKGWYMAHAGRLTPLMSNFNTMPWSTDSKVAIKFASGDYNDDHGVSIVLSAKTSHPKNNFLVNPNNTIAGFTRDSVLREYDKEKEVISVGPVQFEEIFFYISPNVLKNKAFHVPAEEEAVLLKKIEKYLLRSLSAESYQTKISNNLAYSSEASYTYRAKITDLVYDLYRDKRVNAILGPEIKLNDDTDVSYVVSRAGTESSVQIIEKFLKQATNKKMASEEIKKQLELHILKYVVNDVMKALKKMGLVQTVRVQNPKQAIMYAMGLLGKEPKTSKYIQNDW